MNHQTGQSCSNCRNWMKKTGNEYGYCQAHPPLRVGTGLAAFPTTPPETWCGEWFPPPHWQFPELPVEPAKPAKKKTETPTT